ncbi:MAG: 4Fe-4S binding protein [Candidatus Cloacimonetes bacterium]|nr:4Fe-4S binding protein [Candidatus Cloacimonadota bacterium]
MKTKFLLLIIITTFSLFAITISNIFVESNSCVGCEDCINVCPTNAIEIINGKAVIDANLCIDCEICITSCTYKAIRNNK